MKVIDFLEFIDSKFPFDNACGFDNVGLLVGDSQSTVTKVLVTLDCDVFAVDKAINEKAELIITHHPIIFEGLKSITENDIVFKLIKNNISVISVHTNLDFTVGGVNTTLANALDLNDIEYIECEDNVVLQKGTISPICADGFAERIKTALKTQVKYVDGEKPIDTVLICSGAGSEYLEVAKAQKIDAFVTSEVKHHLFLDAKHNNISLFDAGHFNTEDIVVEPLKNLLEENFKETVFITNHDSPIKFL